SPAFQASQIHRHHPNLLRPKSAQRPSPGPLEELQQGHRDGGLFDPFLVLAQADQRGGQALGPAKAFAGLELLVENPGGNIHQDAPKKHFQEMPDRIPMTGLEPRIVLMFPRDLSDGLRYDTPELAGVHWFPPSLRASDTRKDGLMGSASQLQ